VIHTSSEPAPPPPDRWIIRRHAKGSSGVEYGFDAFTAMSLVGHQDVGQFMVNTPAHLAAEPPYSENNFVPFTVYIFSLPAADHGKLSATARAGYLLQIPNKKLRPYSFQSVHNLIQWPYMMWLALLVPLLEQWYIKTEALSFLYDDMDIISINFWTGNTVSLLTFCGGANNIRQQKGL
jgi:hypothetical protein